jgi:hypothetical protein
MFTLWEISYPGRAAPMGLADGEMNHDLDGSLNTNGR